MNHLLFLTFFLSSFVAVSRPLTLINDSKYQIEVILWKDSKVIFHHVMNPNDEVTVEDIGYGLLCQFKPLGLISWGTEFPGCNHSRILESLFMEVNLDATHFKQHEGWFSKITKFGINFQVQVETKNTRA